MDQLTMFCALSGRGRAVNLKCLRGSASRCLIIYLSLLDDVARVGQGVAEELQLLWTTSPRER